MAGGLRLGDAQDPHDVADAEFLLTYQEPEDFQAGFVGQGFKESCFILHSNSHNRLNDYCQSPYVFLHDYLGQQVGVGFLTAASFWQHESTVWGLSSFEAATRPALIIKSAGIVS